MEAIRVLSQNRDLNKLHLKMVKYFQLDIIQVLVFLKDSFFEIYYYQYDSSKINTLSLI